MSPLKTCARCHGEFPATEEYFFADYRNPDGTPRRFKSWCRACYRARHREVDPRLRALRAQRTAPVDLEKNVWLDIAPFRGWLAGLVAAHGSTMVAERIGVKERTLHRWLREAGRVHIDSVDRCLTREGSLMLHELYPGLYGWEEGLAA